MAGQGKEWRLGTAVAHPYSLKSPSGNIWLARRRGIPSPPLNAAHPSNNDAAQAYASLSAIAEEGKNKDDAGSDHGSKKKDG